MINTAKVIKGVSFDIETVPVCETPWELPKELLDEWKHRVSILMKIRKADVTREDMDYWWPINAPIDPAFSKIICASVAVFKSETPTNVVGSHIFPDVKVRSFTGDEEKIVRDVNDFLGNKIYNIKNRVFYRLIGSNLRGFDLMFLYRKCFTYGIKHCDLLMKSQNVKPWDNFIKDTLFEVNEVWKGAEYKSTRLGLICHSLGIPTPKETMAGDEVYHYYYGKMGGTKEENLEKIVHYCEQDVICTLYAAYRLVQVLEL